MHDLTEGPLSKWLFRLAVPSALGYFFSTMYNVVDNWFAGKMLGGLELAAIGRAFPVFFLFIITVDVGLSIGISALVSNALGAKDRKLAETYTAQGLGLGMIAATLMVVIGLIGSPFLLRVLGAEGEELTITLAYIVPLLFAGWFIIVSFAMNGALQATGDTITVGAVSLFGFLANMVLNWLFIELGYGIRGIGLATLVITFINCGIFGWRLRRSGLYDFTSLRALVPRPGPIKEVLRQSLPAMLSMTTVAGGIFIITYFVAKVGGSDAVAAYITATRIEQIVLLPCIGMNAAVLAMTGQNFGAGLLHRARGTLVVALKVGTVFMLGGGVLVWFIARPMMAVFTDDAGIIQIGVTYLRITVLLFLGYMVLFLVVAYLQGLKKPMFSLWIGIYRQLVMPVLIFSVLLHWFELPLVGLWWGVFAINWSAAFITLGYAWWVSRELVSAPSV